MPIILTDDALNKGKNDGSNGGASSNTNAAATAVKPYTPKFFNSKLTGSGKATGMLCAGFNPAQLTWHPPTTTEHIDCKKEHYINGQTTVDKIPLNTMTAMAWKYTEHVDTPSLVTMGLMAKYQTNKGLKADIYLQLRIHSIIIEETDLGNKVAGGTAGANGTTVSNKTKKTTACYQIFIYSITGQPDAPSNNIGYTGVGTPSQIGQQFRNLIKATQPGQNNVAYAFSCDPVEACSKIFTILENEGCTLDRQSTLDYLTRYSVYDDAVNRAEEWQTAISKHLHDMFVSVSKNYVPANYIYQKFDATGRLVPHSGGILTAETVLTTQLEYLETYPVPLDLYREIYDDIRQAFPPSFATELYKHNLNLLLSDTMYDLNTKRNQLTQLALPTPVKQPVGPRGLTYSPEQTRAISCTDPLVLVQSGAGTGKSISVTEPILTPTGWTTMGELKVGDMVIGSDGLPHKVLRIHEKGLLPGYHLTFRDGAKIDCCGEHLWTVNYVTKGEIHSRTITTNEWIHNRKYRNYVSLPIVQPIQYVYGEKDLPLDPYFLGALLADGSLDNPSHTEYRKSNMDVVAEVSHAAKRSGYNAYECTEKNAAARRWNFKPDDNNPVKLHKKIRDLNLSVKSHDKFIPEEYKTASIAQRKALLNGLFDSDGDIRTSRGYARYNTASDQLAEDVLQMLWSLGLNATKQRQKNKKGDYWSINLYSNWDPFIASEYAGQAKGAVRPMRRSLVNAEPFDPVPMRCIEVDAPDKLYVTRDFIVTHNSSVILGRVDWMIQNGVSPKDIMIISFTNAAADNIMTKNPYVQSMTIAKMIHTIYNLNFPTHELSTPETLANSLEIYFPNDPLANQFQKRIMDMKDKRNNDVASAYTQMNNFIERHLQDILKLLDGVQQTSLELEIIICYQMINQLQEPPDIASKFLIIDEVQDNSVFEFIYALKYVQKHNEALFIVGDCSQTLYEFRASNPRALNVLEGSGVFATHKLQTNYRSNQEILDFANVLLQGIEANQYAQIQLQASSFRTVTEKSFTDAVKFQYHRVLRLGDLKGDLPTLVRSCIKPYVDECLRKGEQVAFLAYKRENCKIVEATLNELYPNAQIANITSDKFYPNTLFSSFIQRSWNILQFAPTQSFVDIIVSTIQNDLSAKINGPDIKKKYGAMIDAEYLNEWRKENKTVIDNWQRQTNTGQLSINDFMSNIKQNMLQFEIHKNAVKQSLLSSKKRNKDFNHMVQTADIIISTIHGAKGLEFPHVILLFQSSSDMKEEDKRMYYVGLTRAMISEYVLAFDTVTNPKVKADYDTIIKQLHQTSPASPNPTMPLITGAASKTMTAISVAALEAAQGVIQPGVMPPLDQQGNIIMPAQNPTPAAQPDPASNVLSPIPPTAAFSTPKPTPAAQTPPANQAPASMNRMANPPIYTPPMPMKIPTPPPGGRESTNPKPVPGTEPAITPNAQANTPAKPAGPTSAPMPGVIAKPIPGFNPGAIQLPTQGRGTGAIPPKPTAKPGGSSAPIRQPMPGQTPVVNPTGGLANIMAALGNAPKRQNPNDHSDSDE